jgi:hypothetical protein
MKNQSGQALIVLLFFMIIAITLSTTAIAVVASNSLAVTSMEESTHALEIAEAGAQDGLIRLIRAPNFSGETLTVSGGSATVVITGASTKTILSTGVTGTFKRKIQVIVSFTNGIFTVTGWQEVP